MQQAPRHLIILSHPTPGSFNHQVAETYARTVVRHGQHAEIRDLYALGFDPLLRLDAQDARDAERALLEACDVLVLVYPIWFGLPPAITKGYVDCVLGAGFRPNMLRAAGEGARPLAKHFLTLSTSATTLPWLHERGQWESLRQAFDRYLETLFGFHNAEHVHLDAVVENARPDYLRELLARVEQGATYRCSEIARERHAERAAAAVARRAEPEA